MRLIRLRMMKTPMTRSTTPTTVPITMPAIAPPFNLSSDVVVVELHEVSLVFRVQQKVEGAYLDVDMLTLTLRTSSADSWAHGTI